MSSTAVTAPTFQSDPTWDTQLQSQRRKSFRKLLTGLAFISPWIIGAAIFQVYPFFASLYYSFRDTTMLNNGSYIGLDNYRDLLHDDLFWRSLKNTFYYTIAYVLIGSVLAVGLALLLNRDVSGQGIYRSVIYLPTIVPLVAASVVWIYILHPAYGPLNYQLSRAGLPTPGWFSDPTWAMPGLVLIGLWGIGNVVIIYLAGLQDIPVELYEAAKMDGASTLRKHRDVTLPLLTPVILFNSIIGLISGFQYFVEPYVITQGGPADSTMTYGLYLYQNAFEYFKMGYASAMAWILFVIIMAVTLLVMRSSSKWVFYQGR